MQTARMAIFLPRWVGDVVMATPVLRALREQLGPQVHITGVLKPYVREVLAGTPWIDDYLLHDYRSADRQQRGWHFVRQLRENRFDTILLLTNSLRTGFLAWLSGARQRIGYARFGDSLWLTHVAQFPRAGRSRVPHSAVDSYVTLAELMGCSVPHRQVELATTGDEERMADEAWKTLNIQPHRPLIGLSTGGAYGAAKRWPDEHFGQLARQMALKLNAQILVVCGPAEREAAERIVQLADHSDVRSLAEQRLSIGLTKACLKRCQLAVATDSGPRHLAAALGVPTIGLFGPTDPRWSRNYGPSSVELYHSVPCGPCARRSCPLGHHACMRDLTADRVFREVEQLWPAIQGQRAA